MYGRAILLTLALVCLVHAAAPLVDQKATLTLTRVSAKRMPGGARKGEAYHWSSVGHRWTSAPTSTTYVDSGLEDSTFHTLDPQTWDSALLALRTAHMPGDGAKSIREALHSDRTKRIVGGTEAQVGKYPWMVAIERRFAGQSNFVFTCTGIVVSDRWIMTAGHCLTTTDSNISPLPTVRHVDLRVVVGCQNLNSFLCREIGVVRVEVHPHTNANINTRVDIGMMLLSQAVGEDPVALDYTTANHYSSGDPTRQRTITGWGGTQANGGGGSSATLQEVDVTIRPDSSCADVTVPNFICAGDPGQDACFGDSGGPLTDFVTDAENPRVFALVSFGITISPGGDPCDGTYGGYQKLSVPGVQAWIEDTLSNTDGELPFDPSGGSASSPSSASSSLSRSTWIGALVMLVLACIVY